VGRRLRLLLIANVALWAAIAAGLARSRVQLDALGWDLGVLRDASRLWLAHRPLYDVGEQTRMHLAQFGHGFAIPYPFAYPPIMAMEMAPLAWVPQPLAFAVVALASVLALAWAAWRTAGDARAALWVTVSYPAVYALLAGQLVFVALALFAASYGLLRGARPLAAGLVASLLAYKPQLLVALPVAFLILPRGRRALAGLAAGVAAQVGICFAFAPRATLDFPRALSAMAAYTDAHFRMSLAFTWRGFFASLLGQHRAAATALAAIAVCASGAVAVAAMYGRRRDEAATFAIAVFATLACAWHCAPYDWVLLAIPAWLLLPRLELSARATRALVALLAATWVIVPIVDAQQSAWGAGLHPAMPLLAASAVWLVRAAPASTENA